MRVSAYLALAGILSLPACAEAQPGYWGYQPPQYGEPYATQYAPEYRPQYAPQPFYGERGNDFYRRDYDRRYEDRRAYYGHDGRYDEQRRQQEVVRQQQQYNQRLLQQQQQHNEVVLQQQRYNDALLKQQQAYNAAKLAQQRAAQGR